MEIILIILTSTLMGALFFACYQFGVKEGMSKQADLDSKKDVIEVDDKDKHNRLRGYKEFSEYQG